MNSKRVGWIVGGGCIVVLLLALVLVGTAMLYGPRWFNGRSQVATTAPQVATAVPQITVTAAPDVQPVPTMTAVPQASGSAAGLASSDQLVALYQQVNPGVVAILVETQRGTVSGEAAGSGFVLDDQGHIVTNNHVVSDATSVTVVFYNGFEEAADVVGTDPDSDLAVIKVASMPDGVHALELADSDQVQAGQMVIAIGNPFGLQSSMTLGIVSAVGRTLPTGVTQFSIPQAIQTDAAINPGNSGGPLMDMAGQVIGVNAQIATGGTTEANAGVGFAIPVNVVRRVAPELIANGSYTWPWMGVSGTSVDLSLQQANDLPTQDGAYIVEVVSGSPAESAGLRGSTSVQQVNGVAQPVGGDVILAIDGNPVVDFSDLLVTVAFHNPGDTVELTVLRDGQQITVPVTLAPRPSSTTG